DIDRAVPFFFGHQVQQLGFADTRVVVKDIEAAEAMDGFLDHPLGVGGLRHVGLIAIASPPLLWISAATACAWLSAQSAIATLAPSCAKSRAVALPIPDPPPVIRAILLASLPIKNSLLRIL